MKMTKQQKVNLLEFLNRTQLIGKEAVTLINLMGAIAEAEEDVIEANPHMKNQQEQDSPEDADTKH